MSNTSKIRKINRNRVLENIFSNRVNFKLEEFREYTSELELKFSKDKNRLEQSFKKALEGVPEEQLHEICESFAVDKIMVEEIFIGMYRKSTIVSLYSFLETSLNHLCEHLYRRNNYPISHEDLRRDGIERTKQYLEKMANVDFATLNGEWCHLQALNKIRNCIVHCDGKTEMAKDKNRLLNIVQSNKRLSLGQDKDIKIRREYIDFNISQIESFLIKLYGQVFNK